MSTARQIEANRNNAQLSTGPRTSDGKAASSTNALIHGLFATRPVAIRTGVFAEDDATVSTYLRDIVDALAPRDAIEREQAHRIAMCFLRLGRVGRYEAVVLGDDGEVVATDDCPDGLSDAEAARGLLATMANVTAIEARTSQGLDRALLMYERLRERPLDEVEAIDIVSDSTPENEPDCHSS